jgi:hypothetical protein
MPVTTKWDGNKKHANEEFWQQLFTENTYVLSQLFSVPIVFIKDLGLKFQRVRMIPVPPKKLGRARPNLSRDSRHRAEAALG